MLLGRPDSLPNYNFILKGVQPINTCKHGTMEWHCNVNNCATTHHVGFMEKFQIPHAQAAEPENLLTHFEKQMHALCVEQVAYMPPFY